ncbi:Ran GTPase-activating protein 1 [Taphrina deformans PYCC 5710]|uniref:Ran GTPase-activating protein 1 n=1 Tax=Taphrina deformans (strain PYCC 5710 / ATCC 11124 / CBS 356.35 / IMI 108563 / JCM 9778 / NBRC 8474) TaxID=1097556 RepID=R4XIK9_TAPDE|nr:Ran GTPase-activating protein 1 [Taphrina deformans PYCC 5710]|eukprot:CCG83197.1 Ran GTPase-activating protein 1 [Taphrina deformans PYCC 5710]
MSIFSVEGKGIKFNTAADIEPFLSELHDDVTEIRLSGNTFGVEASVRLAKALENKSQLQVRPANPIPREIPAALEALLPALQTCAALQTVNLCDNAFGPTAAAPLENFFASHTPLRHLHLQNNGMGPEAGARMANALARNTAALETVVCGRNRLENGSVAAWINCFTAHQETLSVVKMPQNGIRPEGIERLMRDGLSLCSHLRVVDMQDNTFTQHGSVSLANALPKWPGLEELAVGDCLLSARGGVAVAEALQRAANKGIKVLRLQYNEIDAAGLKALRAAVELGLPQLETLELNGNKFAEDDASIDAIREMFESRGTGELDELDDLEEDSDAESEEDDANDDDDDDDDDDEGESKSTQDTNLSPLDAAIEKNLAAAMNATSLTS